jgi:hypothetical protein
MERTLAMCNRYESDQVVERCVKILRSARADGKLRENPKTYEHEVTVALNFLDSIAIGIQQGLYDERLARDHTESIVQHYYEQYLRDQTAAEAVGIFCRDYERLCSMAQKWAKAKVYFQARPTWWRLT